MWQQLAPVDSGWVLAAGSTTTCWAPGLELERCARSGRSLVRVTSLAWGNPGAGVGSWEGGAALAQWTQRPLAHHCHGCRAGLPASHMARPAHTVGRAPRGHIWALGSWSAWAGTDTLSRAPVSAALSSLGPATCSTTLAPQALPASNSSPPNLEPGAVAGPHGRSPRPLAHSCTGRVEVSLQPRQPGLSSQDPRPAQPSWSTWLLRPRHAWLELLAGPRPTAASGQ